MNLGMSCWDDTRYDCIGNALWCVLVQIEK